MFTFICERTERTNRHGFGKPLLVIRHQLFNNLSLTMYTFWGLKSWLMSTAILCFKLCKHANIADIHLQSCFTWVGHGGTDNNIIAVVRNAGTVSLHSDEPILTSIVHNIVKIVVTLVSSVKYPHSKPVGIEDSVKGHRVHDCYDVAVVVQVCVQQIVGEYSDWAGRSTSCLAEHSTGSWAGTHYWWWRDLTAATLRKHPEKTNKQPIRMVPLVFGLPVNI